MSGSMRLERTIIASCIVFSMVGIAATITWAASNCTIKVTSGRFVPRRYYVNCSNLRMPDLPRGRLPTVGVLDMTGNSVTTVGVESFRSSCAAFKATRTLDLSNNLISSIHNDSFGCFVALERLHLQLNNIDILFRWVFRGLAKLKVLNLSANSLVQVPQQSIGGLPRLESLDLSANPLHDFVFDDHFSKRNKPPALKRLYLVGLHDSNIKGGRGGARCSNVAFYEIIDLSQTNRVALSKRLFACYKIGTLYLSDYPYLTLPRSMKAFQCSTIDSIDIRFGLRSNRPMPFALDGTVFSGLQCANLSTTVRRIRIRYTTINTVGNYTFSSVTGLRRIDLSHNKLASVHSAAFSNVPSLREIDLSNNNLQRVPFLLRSSTPRTIDRISLAWNKIFDDTLSFYITATTEQASLYNQARYVDLAGNWFTSFRSGEIDTALEGINVSHCKIQDLEKGSLPLLTNITLRTLDLSYNRIAAFPTDWLRHLIHLEYVDYSGNRVLHSPFPVKAFRNNHNLTHVAFNQVDGIQRGLNAGMFSGLKVEFLFLSKCNIRQISSSAFNGSTHMKVIDLSWNKISMIPGSLFRHNPMLEVINLRGNRISQMDPAAFAFLAHLRSLDVQNNRFLCDCDIVPLQQWIIENTYTAARHRRRVSFQNATCFQQSSHAYLEMLRWDAGKQCWMKSTVVTGIVFASVLLVVCCVAFAYSSRFQALFWYEMVKAKISYRRKVPADAFGGNEYNAYISCVPDSNDEAWVVRHLLSAIENPPYELEPMKLCFPSRDFRPGRPKMASAASGIRSAERTLVILSAGYARCSWTRLELSMVSEMWRSGERSAESLVVVYLKRRGEDWVDVERLPALGVRKNRWLIWPLEVADRPAFWMKLRQSLMK